MTIEQKNPTVTAVSSGAVPNAVNSINNRFNREETANHGYLPVGLESTNETWSEATFWGGQVFGLTAGSPAPGGPATVNVPGGNERGIFTIVNLSGFTVTVQISGQSATAPTVANGNSATLVSDGINVRTAAGASGSSPSVLFLHQVAVSDETTDLTVGTGKVKWRNACAHTLSEVRASLNDASESGGSIEVNVKQNGTTIFSTNLTIDALEKTSTTAAVPAVLSTTAMIDDAEMSIDIVAAGVSAAGLKVTFIGTM